MFMDEMGVLFNPFSVGPSQSECCSYKKPSSTIYPQPLYETWPPKGYNMRSISKDSLAQQNDIGVIKSQRGEVSISKAINQEMTAAKQSVIDEGRINAGLQPKSAAPETDDSKSSLNVIMPIKKTDLDSKASSVSVSDIPSVAPSGMSANKSNFNQHRNNMSMPSHFSKRTESNITLTAKPNLNAIKRNAEANQSSVSHNRTGAGGIEEKLHGDSVSMASNAAQADNASRVSGRSDNILRVSVRSKANDRQADSISRASVRSKATDRQADNKSRVSVKSKVTEPQADNISRVSLSSKAKDHNEDNKSRVSIKSKGPDHETDNKSRVSVKSKATDPQADNISRISAKSKAKEINEDNKSRISVMSKANDRNTDNLSRVSVKSNATNQADNRSHVSVRSKTKDQNEDNVSRVSIKSKTNEDGADNVSVKSKANDSAAAPVCFDGSRASVRDVAAYIKKEMQMSMTTTKALCEKAAQLSDRLRAGNELKHNRFHSLIRMYTQNEPLKRCREDRMSFWFKDAVLS